MAINVYSSPGCGVCTAVKHYLKRRGVEYREYDISRDPDALQEMVNLTGGARTVPVVSNGYQTVIGFDSESLERMVGAQE